MGKPAARLGDMTAHGGVIVAGFPMVIIGGKPAARVSDMHVCPMMNPGPSPHVGGPCAMGSAMVLIGGMPAARMGDMLICSGPPDTIAMGCPTVLIGEGGSGSGSAGTAGAMSVGAAIAAHMGAATALFDNNETTSKVEHWIEFEFVDTAGNPVSGYPYQFTDAAGNEARPVLRTDGKIRRDALQAGACKVKLFSVSNAKWSKEQANVGEKVKLSAAVEGYEAGATAYFQIYQRDFKGTDVVVATIETQTQANKVEAEWEYVYPEENDESAKADPAPKGYSAPEYYFETIVGHNTKARSGSLAYKSFVEISFVDDQEQPVTDEPYNIYFSTGEVRQGKLDKNGYAKVENIPPAKHEVIFPEKFSVHPQH